MSDFVTRWEQRLMREQFQRSRQDVMDRAAAEGLDADAFWGEAAALLSASGFEMMPARPVDEEGVRLAPMTDEERREMEAIDRSRAMRSARERHDAAVEAEERAQQGRSRAQHGMTDTRRMLEEDELMRKVARGAAPPPTGGA